MTLSDMARKYGMKPSFLRDRLRKGYCIECAITKPKSSGVKACLH